MGDLSREPHLGEEIFEVPRVLREVPREELEGHRMAELQIVCPIHLTHAAAAEQRDNAVSIRNSHAGQEAAVTR
jgi:hypothetical protein